MPNFIDRWIDYTKECESPTEFWRWAAIGTLAAVLRDNIFLNSPFGVVYPNMYIILYSDSGICRKAAPCKFAGRLIQEAGNTKFIEGRASMQAVVRELGRSYTNDRGDIIHGASGVLFSEELSSFVVDDPAAIPLLIELYDYHERWSNNLISSSASLKQVCVSLLAASNSDLFNCVYTDRAIKGGLLGRTFIVKEEKPRHRKSLLELASFTDETKPLTDHLRKLAKMQGLIKYTAEAEYEYNSWYHAIPDEVFIDKIGFGSRLGTHVLKVAICLAAARDDFDKLIVLEDVTKAIDLVQGLRKTYKQISFGVGAASTSYQASLIIKVLITEPDYHVSRKKLIQRTFGDVSDIKTLDDIIIKMVQGDLLIESSKNNEPGYKLSQKGIDLIMGGNKDGEGKKRSKSTGT